MARSTVHYADNITNNTLKKLHNKLRPAGTPVQRVEYIIELLLLRIFEAKLKHDPEFEQLRPLFRGDKEALLFSSLATVPNEQILAALNTGFFPFYAAILTNARTVIRGNPSIKVQDQLVLIEEVFSNSNFTNNVNSGNLQEVISLIGELDEERLLKTDLLGDAIESALSETGGTKDIGLYRTPDHIRQFMVGMVQPGFDDLIFDPACGSGGFLFDAFEYVMEGVTKEGSWPGNKAHPEIAAWFKEHFTEKNKPMPSVETSTDFYRNGVMGVEYLGMIRKMASINFYVRGLNPGNILQGDSLARFKKDFDPESKTAILANPPFGAERDQEAYPDVWAEYPKESETTILFVKLMLETLKKHGRCAVVVSEGFMTWDQNSARALRKSLLEDANLRAIISLPQGVFVSKGGQGPKTSILYFEKGEPTRNVWFYKANNDGYSMGTNRKPLAGCQLIEALDLFNRYVKKGEIPPETRHSFSIPVEWIKTLDPRIKERIRTETTEELTTKAAEERAKLVETLSKRLADRKITQSVMDDRLVQHDQLWKGKISATIAQKIERAHLYSFNIPNYRSSLAAAQVQLWHEFVRPDSPINKKVTGGVCSEPPPKYKPLPKTPLDQHYELLKASPPAELDRLLSSLDPRNSLELDMARQFLSALSPETLTTHPHLQTLSEIITSAAKYPRVRLGEYLRLNTDRVSPSATPEIRFKILGVSNEKGVFLNETLLGAEINQAYYRVQSNDFCYNPYRVNVGSIGLNEFDYDNQIISGAYEIFGTNESELLPKYLLALFNTPTFLTYVNSRAHGGVRMNFKFEYLEEWQIPLPPLEEQQALVAEIDRQRAIIAGAEMVLETWQIESAQFSGTEVKLSDIADIGTGSTPARENEDYFSGDINWVLTAEVGECEITSTAETLTEKAIKDYGLKIYPVDSILVAMFGQGKTRGKAALLKCEAAITQNCAAIVVRREDVIPKYVYYFLRAMYETIRGQEYSGAGVPHLNLKIVGDIRVPLPSKDEQESLVADIDRRIIVVEGLKAMAAVAAERIQQTITTIWEL
jgi:type I restriction-modification system DNA methylase subunit/restriction endonuclease S subunit